MEIKLINVEKRFGDTTVLKNINHTFKSGAIHGLFGNNGSGKTTLLSLINRVYTLSSGTILYDEELKEYENISICSSFNAYPIITLLKLKTIILNQKKLIKNFDTKYALYLAQLFKLDLDKGIIGYSTGQIKLLKNIFVLASNCKILIFDEPVNGLDILNRNLFYKSLLEVYNKYNPTIFISSHFISELQSIINDFVIIKDSNFALSATTSILNNAYKIIGEENKIRDFIKDKKHLKVNTIDRLCEVIILDYNNDILNTNFEYSKTSIQEIFININKEGEEIE